MEVAQQPQGDADTNDAVVHGEPLEWPLLRKERPFACRSLNVLNGSEADGDDLRATLTGNRSPLRYHATENFKSTQGGGVSVHDWWLFGITANFFLSLGLVGWGIQFVNAT